MSDHHHQDTRSHNTVITNKNSKTSLTPSSTSPSSSPLVAVCSRSTRLTQRPTAAPSTATTTTTTTSSTSTSTASPHHSHTTADDNGGNGSGHDVGPSHPSRLSSSVTLSTSESAGSRRHSEATLARRASSMETGSAASSSLLPLQPLPVQVTSSHTPPNATSSSSTSAVAGAGGEANSTTRTSAPPVPSSSSSPCLLVEGSNISNNNSSKREKESTAAAAHAVVASSGEAGEKNAAATAAVIVRRNAAAQLSCSTSLVTPPLSAHRTPNNQHNHNSTTAAITTSTSTTTTNASDPHSASNAWLLHGRTSLSEELGKRVCPGTDTDLASTGLYTLSARTSVETSSLPLTCHEEREGNASTMRVDIVVGPTSTMNTTTTGAGGGAMHNATCDSSGSSGSSNTAAAHTHLHNSSTGGGNAGHDTNTVGQAADTPAGQAVWAHDAEERTGAGQRGAVQHSNNNEEEEQEEDVSSSYSPRSLLSRTVPAAQSSSDVLASHSSHTSGNKRQASEASDDAERAAVRAPLPTRCLTSSSFPLPLAAATTTTSTMLNAAGTASTTMSSAGQQDRPTQAAAAGAADDDVSVTAAQAGSHEDIAAAAPAAVEHRQPSAAQAEMSASTTTTVTTTRGGAQEARQQQSGTSSNSGGDASSSTRHASHVVGGEGATTNTTTTQSAVSRLRRRAPALTIVTALPPYHTTGTPVLVASSATLPPSQRATTRREGEGVQQQQQQRRSASCGEQQYEQQQYEDEKKRAAAMGQHSEPSTSATATVAHNNHNTSISRTSEAAHVRDSAPGSVLAATQPPPPSSLSHAPPHAPYTTHHHGINTVIIPANNNIITSSSSSANMGSAALPPLLLQTPTHNSQGTGAQQQLQQRAALYAEREPSLSCGGTPFTATPGLFSGRSTPRTTTTNTNHTNTTTMSMYSSRSSRSARYSHYRRGGTLTPASSAATMLHSHHYCYYPTLTLRERFPALPAALQLSRERVYVHRSRERQLGKGAYGVVMLGQLYPPRRPAMPGLERAESTIASESNGGVAACNLSRRDIHSTGVACRLITTTSAAAHATTAAVNDEREREAGGGSGTGHGAGVGERRLGTTYGVAASPFASPPSPRTVCRKDKRAKEEGCDAAAALPMHQRLYSKYTAAFYDCGPQPFLASFAALTSTRTTSSKAAMYDAASSQTQTQQLQQGLRATPPLGSDATMQGSSNHMTNGCSSSNSGGGGHNGRQAQLHRALTLSLQDSKHSKEEEEEGVHAMSHTQPVSPAMTTASATRGSTTSASTAMTTAAAADNDNNNNNNDATAIIITNVAPPAAAAALCASATHNTHRTSPALPPCEETPPPTTTARATTTPASTTHNEVTTTSSNSNDNEATAGGVTHDTACGGRFSPSIPRIPSSALAQRPVGSPKLTSAVSLDTIVTNNTTTNSSSSSSPLLWLPTTITTTSNTHNGVSSANTRRNNAAAAVRASELTRQSSPPLSFPALRRSPSLRGPSSETAAAAVATTATSSSAAVAVVVSSSSPTPTQTQTQAAAESRSSNEARRATTHVPLFTTTSTSISRSDAHHTSSAVVAEAVTGTESIRDGGGNSRRGSPQGSCVAAVSASVEEDTSTAQDETCGAHTTAEEPRTATSAASPSPLRRLLLRAEAGQHTGSTSAPLVLDARQGRLVQSVLPSSSSSAAVASAAVVAASALRTQPSPQQSPLLPLRRALSVHYSPRTPLYAAAQQQGGEEGDDDHPNKKNMSGDGKTITRTPPSPSRLPLFSTYNITTTTTTTTTTAAAGQQEHRNQHEEDHHHHHNHTAPYPPHMSRRPLPASVEEHVLRATSAAGTSHTSPSSSSSLAYRWAHSAQEDHRAASLTTAPRLHAYADTPAQGQGNGSTSTNNAARHLTPQLSPAKTPSPPSPPPLTLLLRQQQQQRQRGRTRSNSRYATPSMLRDASAHRASPATAEALATAHHQPDSTASPTTAAATTASLSEPHSPLQPGMNNNACVASAKAHEEAPEAEADGRSPPHQNNTTTAITAAAVVSSSDTFVQAEPLRTRREGSAATLYDTAHTSTSASVWRRSTPLTAPSLHSHTHSFTQHTTNSNTSTTTSTMVASHGMSNGSQLHQHHLPSSPAAHHHNHPQLPYRAVAVKVIYKADLARPVFAEAAHNEVLMASQLHHPCLVNFFGIAEDKDYLLFVMDLSEKGNLRQYLEHYGPRHTRHMAPRFLADLVLALEYFRDAAQHPYEPGAMFGDDAGSITPTTTTAATTPATIITTTNTSRNGNKHSRMLMATAPVTARASWESNVATSLRSTPVSCDEAQAQAHHTSSATTTTNNASHAAGGGLRRVHGEVNAAGVFSSAEVTPVIEHTLSPTAAAMQTSLEGGARQGTRGTLLRPMSAAAAMDTMHEGQTSPSASSSQAPQVQVQVQVQQQSFFSSSSLQHSQQEQEYGDTMQQQDMPVLLLQDTLTSLSRPSSEGEKEGAARRGIVLHRDLKPDNLTLTWDYHIKIGDFGSACFYEDDEANRFAGSPAYISPEVILHDKAGPYSDLWAMGCILYELLEGRAAFAADTPFLLTQKIKHFEPDSLVFSSSSSSSPTLASHTTHRNTNSATGNNNNNVHDECDTTTREEEEDESEEDEEVQMAHARDLVRELLQPVPEARLGSCERGGFASLKAHPFFAAIDWARVLTTSNLTMSNTHYASEIAEYLRANETLCYCSPVVRLVPQHTNTTTTTSSSSPLSLPVQQHQQYEASDHHGSSTSYDTREQTTMTTTMRKESNRMSSNNNTNNMKEGDVGPMLLVLTTAPRLFLIDPLTSTVALTLPWCAAMSVRVLSADCFAVHLPGTHHTTTTTTTTITSNSSNASLLCADAAQGMRARMTGASCEAQKIVFRDLTRRAVRWGRHIEAWLRQDYSREYSSSTTTSTNSANTGHTKAAVGAADGKASSSHKTTSPLLQQQQSRRQPMSTTPHHSLLHHLRTAALAQLTQPTAPEEQPQHQYNNSNNTHGSCEYGSSRNGSEGKDRLLRASSPPSAQRVSSGSTTTTTRALHFAQAVGPHAQDRNAATMSEGVLASALRHGPQTPLYPLDATQP